MSEDKKFYDQGWDAYEAGEQFDYNASPAWKDGWRDCKEANIELMGKEGE